MPLRQTSQDSYTGRMTDFDAREPILPAFRATNETNGHSPFEDGTSVAQPRVLAPVSKLSSG
ncbi:Chitin synthase, class 3 [Puccinia graminis f. sp. tritici]|uniref:Chitin synthase, class 3 n=1 Tax=Puccinia graminis f. sp. tritici TaxID=56615 RepID=A0A5B0NBB1_PUCGR|nr:Chitin synthase, class 3 [Puccinia graminis f. sp. tritici]